MSSVTPQQPAPAWHPGSATPPPLGTVVAGKYEIEALLGRGGMGAVYRAQHKLTHRRVALKWLLADDEAMRLRFIREARAMGALEHPNVVGILDIGEDQGAVYLVMEFIEGETLRAHLNRQPATPERAIALLMPALEGIAAAHQAGIVHRDLKPANLFVCLDRDGTAYGTKVLDFGVALSMRPSSGALGLTQSGAVVGTPRYMAPEQIRGDKRVDARADQFAMGLILYEALTGRLPYDAEVYEALVVEIATVAPPNPQLFVSGLPDELAAVVLRALAKDPEDRFPDIATLALALEPFGGGVTFAPPRQAHARRSMLADELADLAMASAALTPSQPQAGATHASRVSGPPTRALGGGAGGGVRASAPTLDDPDHERSAVTRHARGGAQRGPATPAPDGAPTSGIHAAAGVAPATAGSGSDIRLPTTSRRRALVAAGVAALLVLAAGWFLWRSSGADDAAPDPTPAPSVVAHSPGHPRPPETDTAGPAPATAPSLAHDPGAPPATHAEAPGATAAEPAEPAEPAESAAASVLEQAPAVDPAASGAHSASSRSRSSHRRSPSDRAAPATAPSAAMRAVGRSGEFSVEDF